MKQLRGRQKSILGRLLIMLLKKMVIHMEGFIDCCPINSVSENLHMQTDMHYCMLVDCANHADGRGNGFRVVGDGREGGAGGQGIFHYDEDGDDKYEVIGT